jgi:hypothetical protein
MQRSTAYLLNYYRSLSGQDDQPFVPRPLSLSFATSSYLLARQSLLDRTLFVLEGFETVGPI